jgi:hypothetical protein
MLAHVVLARAAVDEGMTSAYAAMGFAAVGFPDLEDLAGAAAMRTGGEMETAWMAPTSTSGKSESPDPGVPAILNVREDVRTTSSYPQATGDLLRVRITTTERNS